VKGTPQKVEKKSKEKLETRERIQKGIGDGGDNWGRKLFYTCGGEKFLEWR